MEPVSLDSFIIEYLNLTETGYLTENFALLGYKSYFSTRNLGFNCIWFLVFPIGLTLVQLIIWLSKGCEINIFIIKFRNKFLTNGLILFLNESYMFTVTSFFLNCFHFKFDTFGDKINSYFTLLIGMISIFFPVFFYLFFVSNIEQKLPQVIVDEQLNDQDFDQRSSQVSSSCSNISTESEVVKVVFVKNEKFVEKWGLITEELNVSKGVKKAVLVLVVILLRKLFLALTVVFMRDFPIVVTFLLCMI